MISAELGEPGEKIGRDGSQSARELATWLADNTPMLSQKFLQYFEHRILRWLSVLRLLHI